MSDLRFNTIAGTVLAACLVVLGLRTVTERAFEPHFPEKPGYEIDISALTAGAAGGAPVEAGPVDWNKILSDPAQIAAGQKVAAKCLSCHNFDPGGPNMTGPNLYEVVNRAAATHGGFAYSAAMKAYGQPWTYDNLDHFIIAPQSDIKGTLMTFIGVKKAEDRHAVIAYLHSLAASPAPIPPPLPAAAPAEAAAPSAVPAPSAAAPAAPH
ncbi:MAG: cytochrome c family protein [Hyphomonadaceae bacterium]